MGVGIFIAISGWFGIRFNMRGFARYLFHVLFVLWTVYGVFISLNIATFDAMGIKYSLGLYDGYWFIIGYLGLYLISPILNSFVENVSKRSFQTVLLSLLLFQCFFSWLTAWYDYYNGYSIILFSFIYLTAAYFRKYPIVWVEENALWLFIAAVLIISSIATFSLWKLDHAARQIRDDNPMAILASVFLLLSFKKIKIQSRIVNWLAVSCFTVYLIHYNPYIYPYLMSIMNFIYGQYVGLAYCFMLLLALAAVYLACTFFDQLRLLAWHGVMIIYKKVL
jgi:hypothetical protein